MESGGDIRLFHPDCVGCGTLDETECFKRKKHDQCCYLLFICDECIQVFFFECQSGRKTEYAIKKPSESVDDECDE